MPLTDEDIVPDPLEANAPKIKINRNSRWPTRSTSPCILLTRKSFETDIMLPVIYSQSPLLEQSVHSQLSDNGSDNLDNDLIEEEPESDLELARSSTE